MPYSACWLLTQQRVYLSPSAAYETALCRIDASYIRVFVCDYMGRSGQRQSEKIGGLVLTF